MKLVTVLGCCAWGVLFAAGCGPADGGAFASTGSGGGTGSGGAFSGTGGGPSKDAGVARGTYDEPLAFADPAPPPISGGTLTLIAQGRKAAIADPDRDQVVVVDLELMSVVTRIPLQRGDEPGRMVEDATGRVHVALRGGGTVATLDVTGGKVERRLPLCRHPRGLAYDYKSDAVHVACVGGELVTYGASSGMPSRKLKLDRDLRDVVVDGEQLLVSRFRAAELLIVDASGKVSARVDPLRLGTGAASPPRSPVPGQLKAAVAWRTIAHPAGGALMVYQLLPTGEIAVAPGGYGGGCRRIIDTGISWIRSDGTGWFRNGIPALLPVDIAADSAWIVVGSAAAPPLRNLSGIPPYARLPMPTEVPPEAGTPPPPFLEAAFAANDEHESSAAATSPGPTSIPPCGLGTVTHPSDPFPSGRVIGVALDPSGRLVVLTREPSALLVGTRSVVLSPDSRKDTGHELFHLGTAGGIACASCHPEGHEDGHVWRFAGLGARRTQSIGGGILGTEPFHWSGDMTDFRMLSHDVFTGRMTGPDMGPEYVDAMASWIDKIPAMEAPAAVDQAAVERGRVLFHDPVVACATCHSGQRLTNNASVDVRTGGTFQVPSLRGLAFRAPYMHEGCAATLEDRFLTCGGGDGHGHTSDLTAENRADLVAYLDTL